MQTENNNNGETLKEVKAEPEHIKVRHLENSTIEVSKGTKRYVRKEHTFSECWRNQE